jgi:hypothetical protein
LIRGQCDGECDDEAAREEGQRGQRIDGHEGGDFRESSADAKPHEEEERDERRNGVYERLDRQQPASRIPIEPRATYANTPLALRPNSAIEIARKAKWKYTMTEKMRQRQLGHQQRA